MEIEAEAAPSVFFRPAEANDLDRIVSLEKASYPADEAASPANLKLRLENASDFFLTAVTFTDTNENNQTALQVIGFICGTLSTSSTLSHESMSTHEPDGKLLCIHSVCVAEEHRRRGVGSRLMVAYVNFVKQGRPDIETMRLLCKDHLVKFYEGAGFSVVGPSSVVHGTDQWIEMVLELQDLEGEDGNLIAHAESETEAEIFVDIPDPEHILLCDSFPDTSYASSTKKTSKSKKASSASPLVSDLRSHFDERFADPLKTTSNRFVWDFWHVPSQYTLMRTPADAFFPSELYDRLEDALIEYGERVLGCRGISPIWCSYYTDGCRQEFHTDSPHGPWAFVLSLTNWDSRTFTGGETMLLNPNVLDFWRGFDSSQGLETQQLTTLIEPKLGRLTVFDPRLPHGVRIVEGGNRDPRHGRIVLHGWFTSPTPFFNGALDDEKVTPVLNENLGALYEALAELPPAVGTATVRLTVGSDGKMRKLDFLTNSVMMRPQGCGDRDIDDARIDVLGCICDHLASIKWPKSDGETEITLPFIFE